MTDRSSPLLPQGILLALFLGVVVLGVVTVLLPSLSDAGDEPGGREAPAEEAEAPAPPAAAGDDG